MQQATISSLKPNVARQEAVRALEPRNLARLLAREGKNSLQRLADAYVPYRLYQVCFGGMNGKAAAQTRFFALDAVEGTLDLFAFPRIPGEQDLLRIQTRNWLEPRLTEARARTLLAEKALRIVFQRGFFRVRQPRLALDLIPLEFHVPYWLGFYGRDGALRCRVLDAVRRRVEGAKARALFERWLAE